MTIDKAIELLKIASQGWPADKTEDYYTALELGIEALKEVKLSRICPPHGICALLPGETEI